MDTETREELESYRVQGKPSCVDTGQRSGCVGAPLISCSGSFSLAATHEQWRLQATVSANSVTKNLSRVRRFGHSMRMRTLVTANGPLGDAIGCWHWSRLRTMHTRSELRRRPTSWCTKPFRLSRLAGRSRRLLGRNQRQHWWRRWRCRRRRRWRWRRRRVWRRTHVRSLLCPGGN